MSQAIPGLKPPAIPAPRDAAVALLYRPAGSGTEVYWVKRGAAVHWASFYAFPGGGVDAADTRLAAAQGDPEATFKVAVARELFEETGVLLAQGASRIPAQRLRELRSGLLSGSLSFPELLVRESLALELRAMAEAGRWVTPPFAMKRFDTRFFLVELPPDQQASVWPGELVEGEWIAPAMALERWGRGAALLHPPQVHCLKVMAEFRSAPEALARLSAPEHVRGHIPDRIEFQRGVRVFPLRTPTLPPATHTNCYVVGHGELLVVDPGSPDPAEQARLLAYLLELRTEGLRIKGLFLSHHHGDHVGGVEALRNSLGLPVYAHPRTSARLERPAEHVLSGGEELVLEGPPPMSLRVVFTPGHAPGHLCLFEPQTRALLCGDMVSTVSTIVIDPPEGDMAEYLASLRRLKELVPGTLFPAHGLPAAEGVAKIDEYLAHRLVRERALHEALRQGLRRLSDVTAAVYTDVHPAMLPLAERSALASLLKLEGEGKVTRRGDTFEVADEETKR